VFSRRKTELNKSGKLNVSNKVALLDIQSDIKAHFEIQRQICNCKKFFYYSF